MSRLVFLACFYSCEFLPYFLDYFQLEMTCGVWRLIWLIPLQSKHVKAMKPVILMDTEVIMNRRWGDLLTSNWYFGP